MAETLSLWEFLRELVTNAGLRDRFAEDPQGALRANGLDHLSPDDVHDALVLAEDNQTADYDAGHSATGWSPPAAVAGESGHEAAVRYLNTYITNYADDFDQDIDAHSAVAYGGGAEEPGIDAVTGDHDTTAFGAGTTVHGDVPIGDGAFASGDSDHAEHGVEDPDDLFTDHAFTTEVDASTHDAFDEDSEHTTSHAFTDPTHVDDGLDHIGGH